MKILITGFEPFGGEEQNPSALLLEKLPKKLKSALLSTALLPVSFQKVSEEILRLLEEEKPDVVICLGQAGGRDRITPERVAINLMDTESPDNDGFAPSEEPIDPLGPNALFSNLPNKALVAAAKEQNLPVALSNTAGTFVCNYLLYTLLRLAETQSPPLRCGFFHLPYLPEQTEDKKPGTPSLSLKEMETSLLQMLAILENLL